MKTTTTKTETTAAPTSFFASMNTQILNRHVESRLDDAKDTLAKFTKRLAEEPSYAMEWSMASFTAAAYFEIYSQVKAMIAGGVTIDKLLEHATETTRSRAASPNHSTMPTSNLMDEQRTSAWAKLAEFIAHL